MILAMHGVNIALVLYVSLSTIEGAPTSLRPYSNPKKIHCKQLVPGNLVKMPFDVIPEERRIVGDCFADVNRCPTGSCILKYQVRRFYQRSRLVIYVCPIYGVLQPSTKKQTVDCGVLGNRTIHYITDCSCKVDNGIVVNVMVVDSETDELLPGISVSVDNRKVENSLVYGEYTTKVRSQSKNVVVSAYDRSGNYISTMKVVDIPLNFWGPINVIVPLIRVAESISINSQVTKQLSISNDPSNLESGVAFVTIKENSFKKQDGSMFTGNVAASVNFIDVSDRMVEGVIPGRFLTSVSGSIKPLASDGMFAFTFKDESGNLLEVDAVTITVRDSMRLWKLGRNGNWQILETNIFPSNKADVKGTRGLRTKRQTSLEDFTINVTNAQWVNIDKIPGAPECFFKARVFDTDGTSEIETSASTTFQPQVLGFITNVDPPQRLRIYTPSSMSPASTCFSVRCPEIVDGNALVGFINMASYESVLVGGINIPVISSLEPRALNQYISQIQEAHNAVLYENVANDIDVFVNYISNATGPFYTSQSVCESSTAIEPAFHFIKPALPAYEPFPDDTELCTARIGLNFRGTVDLDLLENLTLPDLTAVSTWNDVGESFFYTDIVVFELTLDTNNNTILSVCITYRCREVDSPTTTYLSVNAPTIEVTANQTTNETVTIPAFTCYGECSGAFCYGPQLSAGFNGSVIPPSDVDDGPDFYYGIDNDCQNETNQTQFATILQCSFKQALAILQ